jgi:hypothetical protein
MGLLVLVCFFGSKEHKVGLITVSGVRTVTSWARMMDGRNDGVDQDRAGGLNICFAAALDPYHLHSESRHTQVLDVIHAAKSSIIINNKTRCTPSTTHNAYGHGFASDTLLLTPTLHHDNPFRQR